MSKNSESIRKPFKTVTLLALCTLILLELLIIMIGPKINNNPTIDAHEIKDICTQDKSWEYCYGEALADITRRNGFQYAYKVLQEMQKFDSNAQTCHIMAHYIALAAVEKSPSSWQKIIEKTGTSCNYGFIHGTIEGLGRFDSNFNINPKTIPKICEMINEINDGQRSDQACTHIMGHLLLTQNYSGSIEQGIRKSVAECNELPQDLKQECYAGVFMESFTRDNLMIHSNVQDIPWDEISIKHQEDICRTYSREEALACWQEISHMYSYLFKNDPKLVFEACKRAPTHKDTLFCYVHALGTIVIMKDNSDRKYFASLCQPFLENENEYRSCMRTIVWSLIYSSLQFTDKAVLFCESLDKKKQASCFNTLVEVISNQSGLEERLAMCEKLPNDFRIKCLSQSKND